MRCAPIALLLVAACAPKAASDAANPDSGKQAMMAPPPGASAAVFNCTDTAKTEIFALFATDSSGTVSFRWRSATSACGCARCRPPQGHATPIPPRPSGTRGTR
ncbi:MAG: hypothetical protein IPO52_05635 [Gemmatimonadetes bacterium]|nr:hypothetical protein [Gemmatimonadota bacterium]